MYKKQEASYFKPLEFGKTTVYRRKDPAYYDSKDKEITKVEFEILEGEKRVSYLEKQFTYTEYYEELTNENDMLKRKLKVNSDSLEFSEGVIQELILTTMGGGQ